MKNQIGISFSEKYLHINFSSEDESAECISVPYPFKFSYSALFDEHNFSALGELINGRIAEREISEPQLSVALPSHFVHTKRVAVPLDTDEDLMREQVEWELKNYLSDGLEAYKILNTGIEYNFDHYKEVVFVAIKKSVLGAIENLSEKCKAILNRVVPVAFLIEGLLAETEQGKNKLVIKIESSQVDSLLFIAGQHYHSYFDAVQKNAKDPLEALLAASKKRIQDIRLTIDQLPFVENGKLDCYVYGDALNPELEKLFAENLSDTVKKLTVSGHERSDAAIEAIRLFQN